MRPELRSAYKERQKWEAECGRLFFKSLQLLERYKEGGRWKSIWERRLDENGRQKERGQLASLAANKRDMTLLLNVE